MPRSNGGPFGAAAPPVGSAYSVKDCLRPRRLADHVRRALLPRDLNGTATRDSWLVEQLRAAGAVIVGKTHLHRWL